MTLTRREWLAASAVASLTLPVVAAEKPQIIDTHTHFYDPTRPQGVPWPGKGDKVLYRPVLPAEYKKLAEPLGITGTVVVEASPWLEDNQWLLDLAKHEPFIRGIVGRLDLADKDFAKNLDRFRANKLFRGIRIGHDDLKKALADVQQMRNLQKFAEHGLTLDVNGGPEMLVEVAKLAKELPTLRIVVNHMANPLIDGKPVAESYRKNLVAAAGKNVWCKLSALVDGTRKRDAASTDLDFYRPVVDAVWNAFGEDRLVFGTNWPVSDLYAKIEVPVALVKQYVTEKKAAAKVFHTNAVAAYTLSKSV